MFPSTRSARSVARYLVSGGVSYSHSTIKSVDGGTTHSDRPGCSFTIRRIHVIFGRMLVMSAVCNWRSVVRQGGKADAGLIAAFSTDIRQLCNRLLADFLSRRGTLPHVSRRSVSLLSCCYLETASCNAVSMVLGADFSALLTFLTAFAVLRHRFLRMIILLFVCLTWCTKASAFFCSSAHC